jgi:hypothetical protein
MIRRREGRRRWRPVRIRLVTMETSGDKDGYHVDECGYGQLPWIQVRIRMVTM